MRRGDDRGTQYTPRPPRRFNGFAAGASDFIGLGKFKFRAALADKRTAEFSPQGPPCARPIAHMPGESGFLSARHV
jgi:hypothetical protein